MQDFDGIDRDITSQWGWVAIRGVIGILFSFLVMMFPVETAYAFALLFGFYLLTDGCFAVITAWRIHKDGLSWFWYGVLGLVSIVAGVIAIVNPGVSLEALVLIVAFWSLFFGISSIAAAIQLRKVLEHEWFLIFWGVVSVLFAVMLTTFPLSAIAVLIWLISFYAMFFGILYLFVAYRLWKTNKTI